MASQNQQNNLTLGDYLKEVSDGLATFYKQNASDINDPQNETIEEIANIRDTNDTHTIEKKPLAGIALATLNNKDESPQLTNVIQSQQGPGVTAVQVHGNDSNQDNDTRNQHEFYENALAAGLLYHHTPDQAAIDINSRSGNDDNRSVRYAYLI